MNRSLRVLTLALVAALLLSVFAGCSGGSSAPAPAPAGDAPAAEDAGVSGELVFWTQDNEVWTNWFQPKIEEFRAAYPNIKVTDEYFPSWADKLTQAYAAGQEPDVAQTWQGIGQWADAGRILEIPADFALEEKYFEGALVSKQHDGKYYCVPSEINVESPSLYVNMDLLEAQGVSLPDGWIENNGPKDWNELLEFAKSLTLIEGEMVSRSGLAYAFAQWEATFMSLIWQSGGDYRDPANNAVTFQTPEARSALETLLKYCDVNDPDCISDRGNDRYDLFVQGSAAMCVGAPWYAGGFAVDSPDMNYQVFNMPAMVQGAEPYSVATGGWGYIVAASTKYPEASWALVDFLNNPENNGDWAVACGTLSARQDAEMNLDYDPNTGSVEKALSIAGENLQYGREDGAYMLTPSTLIYSIARIQLQQVLETGDIDAALRAMEEEGNAMIAENLGR